MQGGVAALGAAELVGEVKGDAAIALAEGLDAGPCDFAGGDERIEVSGVVAGDACGEDGRFEQRGGDGRALQVFDGVEERVEMRGTAAARREQSLPVGEEAGEGVLLDRFDFAAELGEGFAADLAEDFGVAPFALEAAGTEAAFEDAAFEARSMQRLFDVGGVERKAIGNFAQREGAVGAGIAADEFKDGVGDRLEQGGGEAGGSGMPRASR